MTRAEFTKRTKAKAFNRSGGKCQSCGVKLAYGNIEFHHDRECTFGGDGNLGNCVVLCRNCHRDITNHRVPVIAKSNRQRAAHIGLRSRRQGFRGWKKFDGTPVLARRRASSE